MKDGDYSHACTFSPVYGSWKAPLQHSRQSVDLGGLEPLPVTLACNGCDPSSAVVI
jgi:hypothetical protein